MSLSNANMAKWLGEALDSVFRYQTVINAFHATGICDKNLQTPNSLTMFSQFATAFKSLPKSVLKLNTDAREAKAIHMSKLLTQDSFRKEKEKSLLAGKVIGVPRWAKSVLAGDSSLPRNLGNIRAMQAELQDFESNEK